VTVNLLAFVAAALLEIAGCFAFWMWLRQGRSPAIALLGILRLVAFAAMLTRVDAAFA
jgi:small multidrug resistance family-3 protein